MIDKYSYKNYHYTSTEKICFRCIVASVFLGLLYPFLNNASFFTNLISLFCTSFALIALFIFLAIVKPNKILKFFLFVFAYMLVSGILKGNLTGNKSIFLIFWGQDLRYVTLFALGGFLASDIKYVAYFHHIMRIIAITSVIMGFFSLATIDISDITSRQGGIDSYHLWWASTCCFAYWGYYGFIAKAKKEKRLGLCVLIIYFIIGLLFLKRSAFLNSIIIILTSVLFFFKMKKNKKIFNIVAAMSIGCILIILFLPEFSNKLFNALFERFDNTMGDIESFDRKIESDIYFENSSAIQIMIGRGMGNFILIQRYGVGENSLLNALHLGYSNIIYKGGILYALFYVYIYYIIIKKRLAWKNNDPYYLICYGVAISALISLLYEGSWTYTILPFCISTPIFYAASIRRNQKSYPTEEKV